MHGENGLQNHRSPAIIGIRHRYEEQYEFENVRTDTRTSFPSYSINTASSMTQTMVVFGGILRTSLDSTSADCRTGNSRNALNLWYTTAHTNVREETHE
jgi:hypothetical protein